jgi:hypothetical protein
MITVRKLLFAIIFLSLVSAGCAFGSAANVYITQNGSPTGSCTSNVQTPAFVTTAGNWGSGSSQIGPGTTVLFCGTFNLSVGSSLASFLGSGNSTSPVTFKLDSNAIIQSPAMGSDSAGAFNCNGKSYVTVDGDGTGTIENTANGTGLANARSSSGLYFSNCTNAVVNGLVIKNIYLNQENNSSGSGQYTADIACGGVTTTGSTCTGMQIYNNTLNNARAGININFDSGNDASKVAIYNNTISDHAWGITFAADNASSTASGVIIHDNNINSFLNWTDNVATYHTDGLILYNDVNAKSYDTYQIYNNHFSGSLGKYSATGYIACGRMSTCTIFNNVMVDTGSTPAYGYIWLYTPNGPDSVYNNTLVASSGGGFGVTLGDDAGLGGGTTSNLTVKDNIFINVTVGIHDYRSLTTDVAASDNNVWRTPSGDAPQFATNDGSEFSYATWQKDGFDLNSTTSDPLLASNYVPQSGSSAIGLGANLTPLNVPPLDVDMAGNPRPASGGVSWVSGAFNNTSGGLAPPTGLVAVVK